MEPLESTDSPTSSNTISLAAVSSSPLEEQFHYLRTPRNQLKTFSESSDQQTTPLIQKFPLALKHVHYLHALQLTVAHFHQDLKSERLERQTLQLLVFQLQKDILLIQTVLANHNTGASQKPFTIDHRVQA